MNLRFGLALLSVLIPFVLSAAADPPELDTSRGDRMIAAYFEAETARLRDRCLADVASLEDWKARREVYRKQLLEMLGLDPFPERSDLKATVTGRVEHEEIVVEKLHYQSLPGLYVTGNLYLPKSLDKPAPAILYVCGHGGVKRDGISYGNKVHYHHHGVWFARHGYVCLTIDSLQLGEIESIHHGTYRYGMWWWNNRGYTPAGVEAWNCIRALDYLQSREEVDPDRIGVTGRSGGGVYSWWIAAVDERIKAAVPVAGLTDLENHVVDGCVEGHCDCMFLVNTYQWDYPMIAALVAPRPLLISNSDRDGIFPLDGVVRTYDKVRRIYELYGARDKLGLNITPGPHSDTQDLRVPAFRWLNKYLKGDESPIERPAEKVFEPQDLKVFGELPGDERNTTIHESFTVTAGSSEVPTSQEAWEALRGQWRKALLEKSFAGWPEEPGPLDVREAFRADRNGLVLAAYDFTSQANIRLRLYVTGPAAPKRGRESFSSDGQTTGGTGRPEKDSRPLFGAPKLVVLGVLDRDDWSDFLGMMRVDFEQQLREEMLPDADEALYRKFHQMHESGSTIMAFVAPRGIGPTAWNQSEKKQTQIRRRFMLLGQTLDGMRVWDIRRALQALRTLESVPSVPLIMQGERQAAGIALYASLFEPDVQRLDLRDLARTHLPQRPPLARPAPGRGHGCRAVRGRDLPGGRLGMGIPDNRCQGSRLGRRSCPNPRTAEGLVGIPRPVCSGSRKTSEVSEFLRIPLRRISCEALSGKNAASRAPAL